MGSPWHHRYLDQPYSVLGPGVHDGACLRPAQAGVGSVDVPQPVLMPKVHCDFCTHAILLTPDEAARIAWQTTVARHSLILLADLHTRLAGEGIVTDAGPVLRGTITHLEPGRTATGPAFDALVERLAGLFAYAHEELRAIHVAMAPVETIVELQGLARTLKADPNHWEPRHLAQILEYLPGRSPLGLYDRGPNWLYAALALHTYAAPLYQFDPRLGWVTAPTLRLAPVPAEAPLQAQLHQRSDHIHLEFTLADAHLDYSESTDLAVPIVPGDCGLVLSGKLSLWLWTALAITYRDASWLAVYQPRWGDRALVIRSRVAQVPPGEMVLSSP